MARKILLNELTTPKRFTELWLDPMVTTHHIREELGCSNDKLRSFAKEMKLGDKAKGNTWGFKPTITKNKISHAQKMGSSEAPNILGITSHSYYQHLNHYNLASNRKYKEGKPYRRSDLSPDEYSDFVYYRNEVDKITERQPLHTLENIEKRGRTSYHVDHKYSCYQGFLDNIIPSVIGHIDNLEMLWYSDNIKKGASCSSGI